LCTFNCNIVKAGEKMPGPPIHMVKNNSIYG